MEFFLKKAQAYIKMQTPQAQHLKEKAFIFIIY